MLPTHFLSRLVLGLLTLQVGASFHCVNAKPVEAFEERYFSMEGNPHTMPYRLFVPTNYDPNRAYPLIINLHGLGGSGGGDKQMVNHAGGGMYFADDDFQARQPCFVMIPQEPASTSDHWHESDVRPLLLGLVDAMESEFNIDADRIYLGGVSMGGHGVWKTIAAAPNRFAAAFPSAGWSSSGDANKIKHLPIWAFHASDDSVVGVSGSRNMVAAVRNAGGSVIYTEFDKGGHVIGGAVNHLEALRDWLLAQRKGVVPSGSPQVLIHAVVKSGTLDLSGAAANGVEGVSRVEWQNSLGGSGPAVGTEIWSVSGIPLQNGTNVIRITAYGPAPQGGLEGETSFNHVVSIPHTAPVGDGTAPELTASSPSSEAISTATPEIELTGVVSDNVGVTSLTWSNARGGSGSVEDGSPWSTTIPLELGRNLLTITATDAAGNFARRIFDITRETLINTSPNIYSGPDTLLIAPQNTLIPEAYAGDDGLPGGGLNFSWSQISGPPGVQFDIPTALRPSIRFPKAGDYVLRLSASDGSLSASDEVRVQVRPPVSFSSSSAEVAINLNGSRCTDSDGVSYLEDDSDLDLDPVYSFSPNPYADLVNPVTGTSDPSLYQTAFWARSSFQFDIPVPNGQYAVTLKMIDPNNTVGTSSRDVFIQGIRVLEKFDVREHALKLEAYDLHFPVTVTDGRIRIYHENFGFRAYLAALVVREALPPPTNTAPLVDAGPEITAALNGYGVPSPGVSDDGALPGLIFPELFWSQVSGPGTAYFSDPQSPSPRVSFSAAGTYVLRLDANDGEHQTSDTVVATVSAASAPQIQFDLGTNDPSTSGWTVVSSHTAANHSNAMDELGQPTNVGIRVSSAFLNKDTTGRQDSTLFPSTAIKDGFYTNLHRVAGLTFSGLDPEKTYAITIYGSTTADSDATGIYEVGDVVGTLQAYNNTTDTVMLPGLQPSPDGEIVLSARPDNATGRVVISVVTIEEEVGDPPLPGYSAWIRSLYPEADASVTDLDADPENRGLSNFKAYALGASRYDRAADLEPALGLNADEVSFQFRRPVDPDLQYKIRASEDLDKWTTIATFDPDLSIWTGTATVEESATNPREVTISEELPETEESDRRFYQLIITPQL